MNARGLTCVVTGTTHGIGLETAALIASRGNTVLMLNRNAKRGNLVRDQIRRISDNPRVFNLHCDLASLASVRQCAGSIRESHGSIDVLINNAGIMNGRPELSADKIELTFAVNFLGPFLLTQLLIDPLLESQQGRIVNLASSVHALGRLDMDQLGSTRGYKSMPAYAASKLASVMYTLKLSNKYRNTNLTANCLHPGVVATNLLPANRPLLRWSGKLVKNFMRTAAQAADTTAYVALSPDLGNTSGKYFSANKVIRKPSALARNVSLQEQLWDISMELAGLP